MATTKGHGPRRGHHKGAIDGAKIWWIAPSYPMAREVWRDLKRATRDAWVGKNEVELRIELPGGGSVTVKSADNPDSLRGSGLDGVVMDEAATMSREVWGEVIRPALADRLGWAMFIGTPAGDNWFRELFDIAGGDTTGQWERWQQPSSRNPLLHPDELRAAERQMLPSEYSQEFGAQFITATGDLFPRKNAIVVDDYPREIRSPVRAWDKAGSELASGDWSVGAMLAKHDGLFYVLSIVRGRWNPLDRNKIITSTAEMDVARWRGTTLWIEREPTNGGKESAMISARELVKFAPRFETPSKDKVTRAKHFAAQWLAGNVRLVRGDWNAAFIDELASFPHGTHDDQVDAASMAFNKLIMSQPTGTSGRPRAVALGTAINGGPR
jgi:predicted phage terminase large subunit-like protein